MMQPCPAAGAEAEIEMEAGNKTMPGTKFAGRRRKMGWARGGDDFRRQGRGF